MPLRIDRKVGESFRVNDHIKITVVNLDRHCVSLKGGHQPHFQHGLEYVIVPGLKIVSSYYRGRARFIIQGDPAVITLREELYRIVREWMREHSLADQPINREYVAQALNSRKQPPGN